MERLNSDRTSEGWEAAVGQVKGCGSRLGDEAWQRNNNMIQQKHDYDFARLKGVGERRTDEDEQQASRSQ